MSTVEEQLQAIALTQRLVELIDDHQPQEINNLRQVLVEKEVAFSQAYARNGKSKLILKWQQVVLHVEQDLPSRVWKFHTTLAKVSRKQIVENLTEGTLFIFPAKEQSDEPRSDH